MILQHRQTREMVKVYTIEKWCDGSVKNSYSRAINSKGQDIRIEQVYGGEWECTDDEHDAPENTIWFRVDSQLAANG